jgi:2-dehydropantoate 2-reductase
MMRILVMGAGGVGGYYGGLLALQGHEVTFVARGPQLAAMRERGLELRDRGQASLLQPTSVVESPAEATSGPSASRAASFDLVLFTVKSYDTGSAAAALPPVLGSNTVVLPLQNGVDSIDQLSTAVGAAHVLGGTTQIGARVVEAGVVERFSPFCEVVLGEPSGGLSERAERIAAALREVGVEATASLNVQRAIWEKFMMLAPMACLNSACRAATGQVRGTPETRALYFALMDEVVSVGRASGVELPPESVEAMRAFYLGLPDTHTTSMQRDYEDQRRVELESLAGTVLRRGQALGVPTPNFDALYAILKVRALSFGGL